MNAKTKKIFFITSSIPESEKDWKSVFIADMLAAFSVNQQKILYWGPEGVTPANIMTSVGSRYQIWLKRLMNKGGIAKILRNGSLQEKMTYPAVILLSIRNSSKHYKNDFDYYFVNWLQNAISLPKDGKKLVVTVLGSDMGLLNKWYMKYLLKRVFKAHETILLPNAGWMVEKLELVFGNVAEIKLHPLGIRGSWFTPVERHPALWLSVSRITEKKVRKLFSWGEDFFVNKKLTLIGPNQESLKIPEWINHYNSATLDELKEIWYPKAKALIFLSEHDEGRPQTIIEAMASGVPVVCLDKPLYREFIESGENGYLISDENELEAVLEKLTDPCHNLEVSNNARQTIFNKVGTWNTYVEKINEIL